MKSPGLNAGTWEGRASDRETWRRALLVGEPHVDHSGSGNEKSKEESLLRDFHFPGRGTIAKIVALSANIKLDLKPQQTLLPVS